MGKEKNQEKKFNADGKSAQIDKIMNKVKVNVVNTGKQQLPEYKTEFSSGMDLRADIEEPITLEPLQRKLILTGIHIQLPDGYEAQVRPRSGLAVKSGITVLNTPGTIDEDFIGNIGVPLINLSDEPFTVYPGDRIAQLVIAPVMQAELTPVEALDETERGDGGFGHTGLK